MNPTGSPRLLRPTWMEIDLDRLTHNVGEVRRVIGPERRLIAVVKADAHGLGALEIVPTIVEAGADVIAVGKLQEAIKLRRAGCRAPLLIFGSFIPEEVAHEVVEHGIIPTVWDVEGARVFSRAARGPTEVYLKVDTGFHRLGVPAGDAVRVAREIADLPNLRIGCVYTHFADPIHGEEFTQKQFRCMERVVEGIRAAGVAVPYACAASSAVVSTRPKMYLNAVDPGRLLYGIYYPPAPPVPLNLRPIATAVKSRIVQTKWAEAGESVGYGQAFRATRRTLVGVLPFGWWDGLNRGIPSRAHVLVKGVRCPIIGTLSIEHSLVDLTNAAGAKVGDEAAFVGEQEGESITWAEQASWAGVAETEVTVQLGRTISRVYFKGGQIVGVTER